MAVITISREFATGGRKLGRHLAKKLNYDYVDKSLLQKIAADLGVSEKTLESFEASRKYLISNALYQLLTKHYLERIVGPDKTVVEERQYLQRLKHLVLEMAEKDNVVIIGRAAHFFLKDTQNCYHFRLVASKDWRSRYAIRNHALRPSEVERTLDERDKKRISFLRSVCGEDFDAPLLFHLTLNMSLISFEKAVELCLKVASLGN